MMYRRVLSMLLLALIILSGCSKSRKFTVLGEFRNMPDQRVKLQELHVTDSISVVDTGFARDGKFELAGEALQPGLYQLLFERENRYILLSVDQGNVRVTGDWNEFRMNSQGYQVEGSAGSASLRSYLAGVSTQMRNVRSISIVLDSINAGGRDSLKPRAEADLKKYTDQLTDYIEHYADTTVFLPNALFSVRMLNPMAEEPFIRGFIQSLDRRFPNATQVREFSNLYNLMISRNKDAAAQQSGEGTGDILNGSAAPDIVSTTPDGKELSLSSFRGKFVLVDFWASWCPPCRAENPNVVAAYNKFKNKNFTILGVSLDDDKSKWLEAIKKDNLMWNHVSDLKKWQGIAVRDYKVEAIPTNFLVDTAGKVIARDLRGEALEAKLSSVLK